MRTLRNIAVAVLSWLGAGAAYLLSWRALEPRINLREFQAVLYWSAVPWCVYLALCVVAIHVTRGSALGRTRWFRAILCAAIGLVPLLLMNLMFGAGGRVSLLVPENLLFGSFFAMGGAIFGTGYAAARDDSP